MLRVTGGKRDDIYAIHVQVIRQLEEDVSAARHELARVGGLMGAVAEQMEVDEVKKKKKKGWFGSSSKSKKIDTSKLTASDLDAARRDAAAKAGVSESSLPSRTLLTVIDIWNSTPWY